MAAPLRRHAQAGGGLKKPGAAEGCSINKQAGLAPEGLAVGVPNVEPSPPPYFTFHLPLVPHRVLPMGVK